MGILFKYILYMSIFGLLFFAWTAMRCKKLNNISFADIPSTFLIVSVLIGLAIGFILAFIHRKIEKRVKNKTYVNQDESNFGQSYNDYHFSHRKYLTTYVKYWFFSLLFVMSFANVQVFVVYGKEYSWQNVPFLVIPLVIATIFGLLFANSRLILNKLNENIQVIINKDKLLEQKIEELNSTREQMIESETMASLGRLVAGVAHEINTPIGNAITAVSHQQYLNEELIRKVAEGLGRQDLSDYLDETQEASEVIFINLNRAAKLIQSFKKVAADEIQNDIREFNLKQYIEEVLLSLRPKLKRTQIQLDLDVNQEIIMESNPGAIAQIITNFIDNSIIHAFSDNPAGIEGMISIQAKKNDEEIQLIYKDNGRGIAPENLNHIFDPFFTTANHKGGTGLGLNMIYNLVHQKLKGKISVESELGKGTTFFIDVPKKIEFNK